MGRDSEIRVLREAWEAAVAGQPGLVTIVGEAGIGKTALAEFLAADATADGGTVLRTRCYETERSLFLQPIVEAIAAGRERGAGILEPGERHWDILRGLMRDGLTVGPLVMDAVLAAIALEHGAALCSADRDFARFPGLRWINPLTAAGLAVAAARPLI